MAKQTFTTGQVLTAAQMTSLQQTAMDGGAASAKTASYTLVAADAGTAITMSNASATTITVNTALFAAGDTVYITNLGAGVCTITAGTATVNTSSSLALAQYEGGTLDFTSSSAAIFLKADGAAASSLTLLSTTTLSGSSVTVSISQAYTDLKIFIKGAYNSGDSDLFMRFNGDTGSNYSHYSMQVAGGTASGYNATAATNIQIGFVTATNTYDTRTRVFIDLPRYTDSSNCVGVSTLATSAFGSVRQTQVAFAYNNSAAISSVTFLNNGGTFSGGTLYIYGVK